MKRLVVILMVAFFIPSFAICQTYKMYYTKNYHNQLRLNTATGEVVQIQDDGQSWVICNGIELLGKENGRFCLYETQNMWTFIMLDTYTGRNWQVQFSVKGEDYMFTYPINIWPLAYPMDDSKWINRFQMFATQNMWNFIMLDSYDGRLWQVQYSVEDLGSLICVPINTLSLIESKDRSVFFIQPMISMFQYYLINDETGDMWKFQWSTKGDDYRWIERFR